MCVPDRGVVSFYAYFEKAEAANLHTGERSRFSFLYNFWFLKNGNFGPFRGAHWLVSVGGARRWCHWYSTGSGVVRIYHAYEAGWNRSVY